jgi:DNA repair protein RadC
MTDVIRDLPRDDRPRERMVAHGPETLSDAELLAVVLGSGVPGLNAVQLARQLLSEGLRNLRRRELTSIRGVGPAKAARIAAVFELSRRLTSEEPEEPPTLDIAALGRKLVTGYGHHSQERLGAAFLDARHRIRQQREIFVGTINQTFVSTRDIISMSLEERAAAIVVYHNHPSGDPTPSEDDLSFTRKLQQSLAMVEVELVDHLIIGSHRYHSMAERGELTM